MSTEVRPSLSMTPAFASAVIVSRSFFAGLAGSAGALCPAGGPGAAAASCPAGTPRRAAAATRATAAIPRRRDRARTLIEDLKEKLAGGALRLEEAQKAGERVEEAVHHPLLERDDGVVGD